MLGFHYGELRVIVSLPNSVNTHINSVCVYTVPNNPNFVYVVPFLRPNKLIT